jgi:transposase
VITIGIDPHKASLTAVALDPTGQQLASRRIAVNAGAYQTLMTWSKGWPQRRFAVEGATDLGRGIAQLLAAHGEDVLDVPAKLSARARLLDTGGTRKTDPADATSVAHAAMRHKHLRPVVAEDHTTALRLRPSAVRTSPSNASGSSTASTSCSATSFPAAPRLISPQPKPPSSCAACGR